METKYEYAIIISQAKMPATCWGRYYRIGLVRYPADGHTPKIIRGSSKRGHEVLRTWEKLNAGTTSRCAFERALAEAEEIRESLYARDAARV